MNRQYWFWLNNIEGIGNSKIRKLLSALGTPEEIFQSNENIINKIPGLTEKDIVNILSSANKTNQLDRYNKIESKGTHILLPCDDNYPAKLNELYDKPFILYYIGRMPQINSMSVAVVGSRNCSEYGRSVAREIGRVLSSYGVNVISGMAMGIDSEAHYGAVLAGGRTYAVLAGGVDKCYPAGNFNLYMDIQKNGGIISEYPPGTPPVPGMFPMRNRIISGLSDAVIVVEAGHKSGSLITAAQALEQNRTIYAVPGRIGDRDSQGCNELIAQGAEIISSYEDLLVKLGLVAYKEAVNEKNNLKLATEEKMLYSLLLDFTSKSLESLMEQSDMDLGRVLTALINLEMKGLVRETGKNFYIRLR